MRVLGSNSGLHRSNALLARDSVWLLRTTPFFSDAQVAANKGTRELYESMGEYKSFAKFYAKAHSQGCETVYNLPLNLQQIMEAEAYGPARVLDRSKFAKVRNFVSCCDPITLFSDPYGFLLGLYTGSLTVVKNIGCPCAGHFINGKTYSTVAKIQGEYFKQANGYLQ